MKFKNILLLIIVLFFSQCNDAGNTAPINEKNIIHADSNKSKAPAITVNGSLSSEITCPNCDYKKMEIMPTDVCLLKYTCENCKTVMLPKHGDCCVFCTYGTKKCPSMQ